MKVAIDMNKTNKDDFFNFMEEVKNGREFVGVVKDGRIWLECV